MWSQETGVNTVTNEKDRPSQRTGVMKSPREEIPSSPKETSREKNSKHTCYHPGELGPV